MKVYGYLEEIHIIIISHFKMTADGVLAVLVKLCLILCLILYKNACQTQGLWAKCGVPLHLCGAPHVDYFTRGG